MTYGEELSKITEHNHKNSFFGLEVNEHVRSETNTRTGAKGDTPPVSTATPVSLPKLTLEQKTEQVFDAIDKSFNKADTKPDGKLSPLEIHQFAQRRDIADHDRKAYQFLDSICPLYLDPKFRAVALPIVHSFNSTKDEGLSRFDLDFIKHSIDSSAKVNPLFHVVEQYKPAAHTYGAMQIKLQKIVVTEQIQKLDW